MQKLHISLTETDVLHYLEIFKGGTIHSGERLMISELI